MKEWYQKVLTKNENPEHKNYTHLRELYELLNDLLSKDVVNSESGKSLLI